LPVKAALKLKKKPALQMYKNEKYIIYKEKAGIFFLASDNKIEKALL